MIYGTRGVVEWVIKHKPKPSALSATRPQPECHKSCKARHDNITWFKVFAVGAGPRFTKLFKTHAIAASLSRQSPSVVQ